MQTIQKVIVKLCSSLYFCDPFTPNLALLVEIRLISWTRNEGRRRKERMDKMKLFIFKKKNSQQCSTYKNRLLLLQCSCCCFSYPQYGQSISIFCQIPYLAVVQVCNAAGSTPVAYRVFGHLSDLSIHLIPVEIRTAKCLYCIVSTSFLYLCIRILQEFNIWSFVVVICLYRAPDNKPILASSFSRSS